MIKKIIIGVISVLLIFLLQSSVFSRINIGGIVPNLLIIITACWGFMQGSMAGLLVGFACGMLMDVFYGSFMGFYSLVYMYIGYLNGKFDNMFFPDDIKLPFALMTISDLVYGLSCYVFLFLLRGRFNFGYYFGHIIFPEIIMTTIMIIIVYPIMLGIYKRFLVEKR